MELSAEEVRVVACLVEKQVTTPEYYPLTRNALVNACNQSSNRHPVVRYDDATVADALERLRAAGLVRIVYSPSNRAAKYRQVLDEALELDAPARAVLCVLMLRGPQTVGELRTRTERMHGFGTLEEVQAVLDVLATRDPEPLAVRLERAPGQKEARFAHLLAGAVVADSVASIDDVPAGAPREERVAAVEEELAALRADVDELRAVVEELRGLLS